jgi:subtilisin family serine protease
MQSATQAQFSRYIIELTDKKGTKHTIANPATFLSKESIDRKKRYNISIDSSDLPVSQAYQDSILKSGKVEILNSSRWLNQVLIKTTDPIALNKINQFPFVKKRSPIANRPIQIEAGDKKEDTEIIEITQARMTTTSSMVNYGLSQKQINLHEGEYLHDLGFQGNGVKIAVFDAGFFKYQNIAAFDSLRLKNRIKLTLDLVDNTNSVNEDDEHGMYCLSILAANIPGTYVGSAPASTYYLFRTEDDASEFPIEEQNWIVAAEIADSLGIDLISSSLGYNRFDNPTFNYTYADMNGRRALISRGASIATQKGMIVMTSAGNAGNDSWKYITAPADADGLLSVGAININKQVAPFSSYGPTSDGRIKPEITSVGWGTYLISTNGNVAQGNGTSFSNPNIAGLVACLWQAFPEFNSKEIIQHVIKSADRYSTPDTRVGYGIPNMRVAFASLEKERNLKIANNMLSEERIKVFPNPILDQFTTLYKASSDGKLTLHLVSMQGKLITETAYEVKKDEIYFFKINPPITLPRGQYVLRYQDNTGSGTLSILK